MIAEYRIEFITYDNNDLRDSITNFALVGIDHSFSPRFNISLRGGAEFREYDNAVLNQNSNVTDPYFEGTLIYAVGKQTSISWTNRYGLEEPDVARPEAHDLPHWLSGETTSLENQHQSRLLL